MLTRTQALTLGYGDHVHYTGRHDCTRTVGPRGGVTIAITDCRVTGACKTWKTRPADFRLPVKYGLRDSSAITPSDAGNWHLAAECPIRDAI